MLMFPLDIGRGQQIRHSDGAGLQGPVIRRHFLCLFFALAPMLFLFFGLNGLRRFRLFFMTRFFRPFPARHPGDRCNCPCAVYDSDVGRTIFLGRFTFRFCGRRRNNRKDFHFGSFIRWRRCNSFLDIFICSLLGPPAHFFLCDTGESGYCIKDMQRQWGAAACIGIEQLIKEFQLEIVFVLRL